MGNWGFVSPRFDMSGLLTSDGSVLYRLNGLYRRSDSFRGFDQENKRLFIAPVLSWKISPSTDLTVSLEYTDDKRAADIGLPVVGDRVVDVPRDRIAGEPDDTVESNYLNVGYQLEHRFNDNWKLNNAFRYSSYDYDYNVIAYDLGDFDEETGILNRFSADQNSQDKDYALQTNLTGKFATGSIAHTLLFGVDLSRNKETTVSYVGDTTPLDIFNPVYKQIPKPDEDTVPSFGGDEIQTDSLLVFEHEIDDWAIGQSFGHVVAQSQSLSTATLVDNVKAAYAKHPDWQVGQVQMLPKQEFYTIQLNRPEDTQWEVFVNPYTGVVMGDR